MRIPNRVLALAFAPLAVAGCVGGGDAPTPLAPGNAATPAAPPGQPVFYSTYAPNYATDGFWGLEQIDIRDGHATPLSVMNVSWDDGFPCPLGMAIDLDGSVYSIVDYVTGDSLSSTSQLVQVDPATGALRNIGGLMPGHYDALQFDKCGTLYAMGTQIHDQVTGGGVFFAVPGLYRFDKYTGERTYIGPTGLDIVMDCAMDSKGTLYATTDNKLYRVDLATAATTFVTDITNVPQDGDPKEIMCMAFDDHDVLWGTATNGFDYAPPFGPSPVFRIDPTTGVSTMVGSTGTEWCHGGDIMPSKVTIRHATGKGGFTLMTVDLSALPAHLAHGDYVPGTGGHPCESFAGRNGSAVAMK